jgi:hypothetical protein
MRMKARYLVFDCYLARNIRKTIYFAFHIGRPFSINHIMEAWQSNKGITHKKKLLVGVAAIF